MDEEPVAKRRRLDYVKEETFGVDSGPAPLQSQPQEGFFKIHHTSTLSGLDHLSHVQKEVARNGVQFIAGAPGEIDINGGHGANEDRRDMETNSEVCFGMVCRPSSVRLTGLSGTLIISV